MSGPLRGPRRLLNGVPLALLGTAMVLDLIDHATGTGAFLRAAYWLLPAGLAGGAIAALARLAQWLRSARRTHARRLGAWRVLAQAAVLALFGASWWLRDYDLDVPPPALALSLAGAALALVTLWLGACRVTPLVRRSGRAALASPADQPSAGGRVSWR